MDILNTLDYLYGLERFGIRMGLSTIQSLCRVLQAPQDQYPSVHIGGTNGKGSTAILLASILQAAGYRVGLYTSPHLMDFSERIRVQGVPIPEDRLVKAVEKLREGIEGMSLHPTFFEFTTALAFLYFSEEKVDIAILEVGMGGRLDATNIATPLVSVLTHVDYDHEEHLGDSLEAIAREKCGIIKPGVPCITAESRPQSLAILSEACRKASAPLYRYGQDFVCRLDSITLEQMHFSFQTTGQSRRASYSTRLTGRHQLSNLGLALYAARLLQEKGMQVSPQDCLQGIATAQWEGRLEVGRRSPLVLLDGAHNPGGTQALYDFLQEVVRPNERYRTSTLLFGVLKDKKADRMLRLLLPLFNHVILTQPPTERGRSPDSLTYLLQEHPNIRWTQIPSVAQAMSHIQESAGIDDFVLVTGSLYTVGEARRFLRQPAPPPLGPLRVEG